MDNRTFPLDLLESEYHRRETFIQTRALIKAINKQMQLEPLDHIHFDLMNSRCTDVSMAITKHYDVKNYDTLQRYLRSVCGALAKTDLESEPGALYWHAQNITREFTLDTRLVHKIIPSWINDLQPQLQKLSETPGQVLPIIAAIYSYGYVLRPEHLFNTALVDDQVHNFMDLENCHYYIRQQKNHKVIDFPLPITLCQFIKERVTGTMLIPKTPHKPYQRTAAKLCYHHWPLHNVHVLRHSYEYWNVFESERTKEEQEHWHKVLGHSRSTVMKWYV